MPQLKFETMKKLSHVFYWLLCGVVRFQINNNLFANKGLKKGQLVKYNWKSRVYINSAIKDRIGDIKEVRNHEHNNVIFLDGDSCDPFWVRKIYSWEK